MVAAGVEAVSSQLRSKQRYQFSGAVNPSAGEFVDVVVELVLADPSGQGSPGSGMRSMKPFGARRQHPHRCGLVGGRLPCRPSASHCRGRVAVQFGVGRAGLLEIQDVEEVVAEHPAEQPGSVGTCGRGTGGTLSPATPANRSGCSSGAPRPPWRRSRARRSPHARRRRHRAGRRCRRISSTTL